MKNKFRPLLQVREQEQLLQESIVSKLYLDISHLEEKIAANMKILSNLKIPQSGKFMLIMQSRVIFESIRKEIKILSTQKEQKKQELATEQEKLIEINIEYEKSKYLYNEEHKKFLVFMQKEEQKELEDIGQKLSQI